LLQSEPLDLTISLNDKQLKVFEDVLTSDIIKAICLYGSGRSGKTFLLCYWTLLRAIMYPGSFQLFIRATMTALTGGVVSQTFPNLFKSIEKNTGVNLLTAKTPQGKPFLKYYDQPKNKFILFNGSEIRFLGLDTQSTNKSATDKVLSQEYFTIIFEEGNEIDFEVVEKCLTRLCQKCIHFATKKIGIPKWATSLNPTTFDSWDYIYFQEHKNPIEKRLLDDIDVNASAFRHFHIDDNLINVSDDFKHHLESLSPMQRRRFLEGAYGENFDGEIFKQLNWDKCPALNEFDKIIIYNDPSYKSGPKNDYKATGALGLRKGAYWLIWGEAMQCTTNQMILNNHTVLKWLRDRGYSRDIVHWFENAGMPDDFVKAVQDYAEESKWVCPYKLDNRNKGDKFARIESALVPLNEQGKLYFNSEMKGVRFGNLVAVQFGNFKKNLQPSEHDDIPDMVHGGITLINLPVIQTGGIRQISRLDKYTL
jgi:hypothetical protein